MDLMDISRSTYLGQVTEALGEDLLSHQAAAQIQAATCIGMAYRIITGDQLTGSDLMAALGYLITAEHLSDDLDMLRATGPLTDWCILEITNALGAADATIN